MVWFQVGSNVERQPYQNSNARSSLPEMHCILRLSSSRFEDNSKSARALGRRSILFHPNRNSNYADPPYLSHMSPSLIVALGAMPHIRSHFTWSFSKTTWPLPSPPSMYVRVGPVHPPTRISRKNLKSRMGASRGSDRRRSTSPLL
jgi:hypothetical protein